MRVFAVLLASAMAGALGLPDSAAARRSIPDTNAAIHVWDDQLPDDMTAAQVSGSVRLRPHSADVLVSAH